MQELTLPSGKKAVIRDGKGKDLFQAQKMVSSPDEIAYALIAVLTTIDDKPVMFEDLAEMDLRDLLVLTTKAEVISFLSQQPDTLSISQKQRDGVSGRSKK